MTEVILVNGKKRSGKDFFATKLKEELESQGKIVEIMAFADPIKDIIAKTFNISDENLDFLKNRKEGVYLYKQERQYDDTTHIRLTDFRSVLQIFGTEAMKPWFGEDVWVNLLKSRVVENPELDYVIVPDFRFLVETISNTTVHIENKRVKDESDTHASENELNDFTFKYTINNTGYRDISDDVKQLTKELLNG